MYGRSGFGYGKLKAKFNTLRLLLDYAVVVNLKTTGWCLYEALVDPRASQAFDFGTISGACNTTALTNPRASQAFNFGTITGWCSDDMSTITQPTPPTPPAALAGFGTTIQHQEVISHWCSAVNPSDPRASQAFDFGTISGSCDLTAPANPRASQPFDFGTITGSCTQNI